MASKAYNNIYSYISQYSNIANKLGLGVYNGLLNTQVVTNVTTSSTSKDTKKSPIIHSDNLEDNTYNDTIGVYYVNYNNIINTLNRNIGGSDYNNQGYSITDEGHNLGQREGVDFESFKTSQPLFISDTERDSYSQYIKYIEDNFGVPTLKDSNLLSQGQSGYTVGVRRKYTIGSSVNPNDDVIDTLLGKTSTMALSNIVNTRNIRRESKGFQSITNINYYDKARTDIEESKGIEPLDTSIGFSISEDLPNYGIKKEYAFVGFGNTTLDYVYSSATQNYSLFDRWGELTNGNIALNSSPAYNSIKKSVTYGADTGTFFISSDKTVDMSRFLIHNLKFKNGYNSDESMTTYFGMHSFNVSFDDIDAKHRYLISTNTIQDTLAAPRMNFQYDEGKLNDVTDVANAGVNHGSYILSDSIDGAYGKDLTYVTNNAFRKGKYDTIVSKFATQHLGKDDKYSTTQTAVSNLFGMSHGRNLLKVEKDSQGNVIGIDKSGGNGYDNPYCRVWTYHHQYHRLCDSIRPFVESDGDTCTMDDFARKVEIAKYRNSYSQTSKEEIYDEDDDESYTNKRIVRVLRSEGQDLLRDRSVLNKINGLVNITPTNIDEDEEEEVTKVKNCMFSIENLAWKDASHRGNLSKEQIGPFGGRIMWFPPYGLTFSENISASWNPVSFIGRGENIYTYSNTERSGNLSFMMLIDHPSVINNWREEGKNGTSQEVDDIQSTEQKILRFFAGCEFLTPLGEEDEKDEGDAVNKFPVSSKTTVDPKPGTFSFVVYYPNNYSGKDDAPETAVSYLLNGLLFGETKEDGYKLGYDILNYEYYHGSASSQYTAAQAQSMLYNIIGSNTTKAISDARKEYSGDPYNYMQTYENMVAKFNKLSDDEKVKDKIYAFEAYITALEKKYAKGVMPVPISNEDREKLREICGDSTHDEFKALWDDDAREELLNYITYNETYKVYYKGNIDNDIDNFTNCIKLIFNKGYTSIDSVILEKYNLLSTSLIVPNNKDITNLSNEDYEELVEEDGNTDALYKISTYKDDSNVMLMHYVYDNKSKYLLVPIDVFKKIVENSSKYDDYLIEDTKRFFGMSKGEVDYDLMSDYASWYDVSKIKQGDATDLIIDDGGKGSFLGGYEMRLKDGKETFGISTDDLSNGEFYSGSSFADSCGILGNVENYTYNFSNQIKVLGNNNKLGEYTFFCPWNNTVTKNGSKTPSCDYEHSWGYRVDSDEKYFNQNLISINGQYNNYTDSTSFALNSSGYTNEQAKAYFKDLWEGENKQVYSFAEVVAAIKGDYKNSKALKDVIDENHVKDIQTFIKQGITKIEIQGGASVQGNYDEGAVLNKGKDNDKDTQNNELSQNRGITIKNWLKENITQDGLTFPETIGTIPRGEAKSGGKTDVLDMKIQRCAVVEISYGKAETTDAANSETKYTEVNGENAQVDNKSGEANSVITKQVTLDELNVTSDRNKGRTRYDNEADFFKTLKVTDPFLHHRIVDKIKYFDPAFHSITPEGFGARLTFLQQCTRQGNTIGASDTTRKNATNLAFGRPPVCVLRVGDFYYTKIIIDSINISYENGNGIQWDLNHEGIGVMPMYAKIDLNFKFIGGSDLQGPIGRLQNALSFNYYANTRVYDNRSDKIEYEKGKIENITPWEASQ